jgi:sialic acid synthase SpsE
MNSVDIGQKQIGPGEACYLIAEVGTTCMGDLEKAIRLVEAASKAGMDAVKFQVIDPYQDTQADAEYKVIWGGVEQTVNMRQMFERLVFPAQDWVTIADAAAKLGIEFLATCDYCAGIDLLENIGIAAHKIGAWDTTYKPLIEHIGRTGKPMIVDLGPTTQAEFDDLCRWYSDVGGCCVLPLHDYHTELAEQMNMNAILHLFKTTTGPVGYSSPNRDHDLDFVALALGANVLEKRLILDRTENAFHAHESLEPDELRDWVLRIRRAESAMGVAAIRPSEKDLEGARKYYRSIATVRSIAKGDLLTSDNIDGKRPGTGLPTSRLNDVVGQRANRDLPADTVLSEADFGPQ